MPTHAEVPLTVKLVPSTGGIIDYAGHTVAVSGTTAIVGALGANDGGVFAGAVYLFDAITGEQTTTLLPLDGHPGDTFGYSVAVSGTTAIVGSRNDDDNGTDSGAAYLFDTTNGTQIAKLLPNDGAPFDLFGHSVAISGTTAIVGAYWDDDNGLRSGSAYLFDTTTGLQFAKLVPNDGAPNDRFGYSVAIDGATAIVGALWDEGITGSAYVFDATTGRQVAKLVADDGEPDDAFGNSVAISGTTAIIGAFGNDDNGSLSGSAYLFDTTTGSQIAKLLPRDGVTGDNFGRSVAICGSTAVIGAYRADAGVNGAGSAYLFDTITGRQIAVLFAADGAPGDEFGHSVAIDGVTIVVGAKRDDVNGIYSGSAYSFAHAPAVSSRNAGTNPVSFASGPAWIGADLTFAVDLTTTGHTHALVIGFDSPGEVILGDGQALLCLDLLGSGELFNTGFHEGPLPSIDLSVPDDASLIGVHIYAQALHAFGVSPFALSNAQDLIVGGFATAE